MQPEVYNKSIKPHLKAGKTVGATHGFNFHFKTIEAPKDVDVLLVAPKGPGHLVRSEFEKGGGVPCLLAIHQNPSGKARDIGLAWAQRRRRRAVGRHRDDLQGRVRDRPLRRAGRPLRRAVRADQGRLRDAHRGRLSAGDGVLRVRPRGEAHRRPDLPGRPRLHALLASATPPSTATSPAARASSPTQTKAEMKKILTEIQDGQFAKEWRAEYEGGMKNFKRLYEADNNHPVEVTGRRLRKMMPWLKAKEPPKA